MRQSASTLPLHRRRSRGEGPRRVSGVFYDLRNVPRHFHKAPYRRYVFGVRACAAPAPPALQPRPSLHPFRKYIVFLWMGSGLSRCIFSQMNAHSSWHSAFAIRP